MSEAFQHMHLRHDPMIQVRCYQFAMMRLVIMVEALQPQAEEIPERPEMTEELEVVMVIHHLPCQLLKLLLLQLKGQVRSMRLSVHQGSA